MPCAVSAARGGTRENLEEPPILAGRGLSGVYGRHEPCTAAECAVCGIYLQPPWLPLFTGWYGRGEWWRWVSQSFLPPLSLP